MYGRYLLGLKPWRRCGVPEGLEIFIFAFPALKRWAFFCRRAGRDWLISPIPDHEEAARLYNVCRTQGMECGPVEILICAVAVRRKWSVLANDARLNKCLQIIVA